MLLEIINPLTLLAIIVTLYVIPRDKPVNIAYLSVNPWSFDGITLIPFN
jgi:hypothetical protein